jgi:hypothetical protein
MGLEEEAQHLSTQRRGQRHQPGHAERDHKGVHPAAAGGHLRRRLHDRLAGCARRGARFLDHVVRLVAGAGVLRLLLLLAASRRPRMRAVLGRPRGAPPEPGLQPVHRPSPDQFRRAGGLGLLPADGHRGRASDRVRNGRIDRSAVPVLGAHRARRQARLVRPLVLFTVQPPRASCGERRLSRPQLRRRADRLGPAVRQLPGRRRKVHLRHPQSLEQLGSAVVERRDLLGAGEG